MNKCVIAKYKKEEEKWKKEGDDDEVCTCDI